MYKRFKQLEDVFEIRCLKCGSNKVDLDSQDCEDCGVTISAHCDNCGAKFNYHDFEEIEEV